MAGEYQLSYTGPQVNEKLGKIDGLATTVNNIPSIYETITSADAREQELRDLIGSGGYVLPTASATTKGGVKIGTGLTISGEVLSYTLPTASASTLGGIKIGNGLLISSGVVNVDIVNNLTSSSTTKPLSAYQGKLLNEAIANLAEDISYLGVGDMLKSVYDGDDDGVVDNAKQFNGHDETYFILTENPSGVGTLSLNRVGNSTIGKYSIALGNATAASGESSFAEGQTTTAEGIASHAEGYNTIATGNYSHAEGQTTKAYGINSHAEGYLSISNNPYSHAEGYQTSNFGDAAHSEGYSTSLPNNITSSSTNDAILEAWGTQNFLLVKGIASHAEGYNTLALNNYSHVEGYNSVAQGLGTHAEGFGSISNGDYSHAEGIDTITDGVGSHAEGAATIATGNYSHAEGNSTIASHQYSHAQNLGTQTSSEAQTVLGKYNYLTADAAIIIGNGTSDENRSNIHLVNWDGTAWFAGDVYVHSKVDGVTMDASSEKLITLDEVPINLSYYTNDANYVTETVLASKNYLASSLLNAANGIATLDANKNIITNEGITSTNGSEFQVIDSQNNVIAQIDGSGVRTVNIFTTDTVYTKDDDGNVVETTYNLNEELANLRKKAGSSAQMAYGTYTGTGTYGADNPNSLTFDFVPKMVVIQPADGVLKKYLLALNGVTSAGPFDESGSSSYQDIYTWEENTFTWYHSGTNNPAYMQYNESGATYYYFAIGSDS